MRNKPSVPYRSALQHHSPVLHLICKSLYNYFCHWKSLPLTVPLSLAPLFNSSKRTEKKERRNYISVWEERVVQWWKPLWFDLVKPFCGRQKAGSISAHGKELIGKLIGKPITWALKQLHSHRIDEYNLLLLFQEFSSRETAHAKGSKAEQGRNISTQSLCWFYFLPTLGLAVHFSMDALSSFWHTVLFCSAGCVVPANICWGITGGHT